MCFGRPVTNVDMLNTEDFFFLKKRLTFPALFYLQWQLEVQRVGFFKYFILCGLADSTLHSFLLSPSVHEMWTAGGVRCLPNPENYQNSEQIIGQKEKCCWTTVPTGSKGRGTKQDHGYILIFSSETVLITVA